MNKTRIIAFGLAALLIFLGASAAGAGSSATHSIDWQVLSGGGAPAAGGNITLNGTMGQTAIGLSTGTNTGLSSGYWYGTSPGKLLYFPIIFRSS